MNAKPLDALKSLSELALSAPEHEPLVIYDSVAAIAEKLAEGLPGEEGREMAAAAEKATATACAVRHADRRETDFREFLNLGDDCRMSVGTEAVERDEGVLREADER